jgi:hypothetical protein
MFEEVDAREFQLVRITLIRITWLVWGGPPGPQPTPPSASPVSAMVQPDRGSGAGEGVRLT